MKVGKKRAVATVITLCYLILLGIFAFLFLMDTGMPLEMLDLAGPPFFLLILTALFAAVYGIARLWDAWEAGRQADTGGNHTDE